MKYEIIGCFKLVVNVWVSTAVAFENVSLMTQTLDEDKN